MRGLVRLAVGLHGYSAGGTDIRLRLASGGELGGHVKKAKNGQGRRIAPMIAQNVKARSRPGRRSQTPCAETAPQFPLRQSETSEESWRSL